MCLASSVTYIHCVQHPVSLVLTTESNLRIRFCLCAHGWLHELGVRVRVELFVSGSGSANPSHHESLIYVSADSTVLYVALRIWHLSLAWIYISEAIWLLNNCMHWITATVYCRRHFLVVPCAVSVQSYLYQEDTSGLHLGLPG